MIIDEDGETYQNLGTLETGSSNTTSSFELESEDGGPVWFLGWTKYRDVEMEYEVTAPMPTSSSTTTTTTERSEATGTDSGTEAPSASINANASAATARSDANCMNASKWWSLSNFLVAMGCLWF